jgi:hypothetical protein
MFTPDALLRMGDGGTVPLANLAKLGDGASLVVATKPNPPAIGPTTLSVSFQASVGEFVELAPVGSSLPVVKCSPRAKLLLSGGGFVYAGECCNGATVETDSGTAVFAPIDSGTGELVSIRLYSPHVACVNGIWFLTD